MTRRRPPDPSSDDYEIGRGRPPKASRFRKGESGNPEGRPRGTQPRIKSPIEKLIVRGVMMTVGGVRKRVPITDFTAAKLMQEANKGSVPALRELNRMAEAAAATRRLEAARETPHEVSFTISGLYNADDAICILNLATRGKNNELVLDLSIVAFAVQRLGRSLTAREQQIIGQACPGFAAWYAKWGGVSLGAAPR